MKRFSGRTAIVTGAAAGIGRATAIRLANEGARLVLADYDARGAESVATAIAVSGGEQATVVEFDAGEPASCIAMVDSSLATLSELDLLCNIAGIWDWGHFADFPADAWERVLRVDLSSAFYITQRALPALLRRKGNVVNMASAAALTGLAYNAAYCAAKAGLVAMTKSIAVEYAAKGLRANAICPGGVATAITAKARAVPDADPKLLVERHFPKTGKFCEPEEIAAAVAYLASDEACNITGIALTIDGGQLAG
jgi:meso-butanediol dehydrogenase / (S,S)-butanediol dehydrogenase / diacetyl reductase